MRDFKKFMEENREKAYKIAYANCKHDAEGHCIFPADDPWMQETAEIRKAHDFDRQGTEYIAAH